MRKKADLADALAEISGSTRRKPEPEAPQAPQAPQVDSLHAVVVGVCHQQGLAVPVVRPDAHPQGVLQAGLLQGAVGVTEGEQPGPQQRGDGARDQVDPAYGARLAVRDVEVAPLRVERQP